MRWVVVGGGSAGCVVAGRLAEAGHDVRLIEAGVERPPVRASFFDTMAAPGALFAGPFVRGRGLGGSGAVNGMVVGAEDPPPPLAAVAPSADELGPLDRALLAAAADAAPARLTMRP